MNSHYAYPLPAIPYIPPQAPPQPPYVVPRVPQYGLLPSPPGLSLNGHHPGYLRPHPHPHPYGAHPNTPYSTPNYQVDPNGWYTPQSPQRPPTNLNHTANTPMHPPGLHVPAQTPPQSSIDDIAMAKSQSDNLNVHEFWRGRLAPLPGYRSRPELLPMRGTTPVESQSPVKKSDQVTLVELLPPHSFFGAAYERKSPTIPTKILQIEKKDILKLPPSPTTPKSKNNGKDENKKKEFKLDKYAEAYVPQYLYDIQKETHPLNPLPAIPVFPSISYLQSFLIPGLIDESLKSDIPSLLHGQPIPKDSQVPPLDTLKYLDHWTEILRWELDAIAHKKEQIVLWKIGAKVAAWKDAEFMFSVPGIRENHPHLQVGDLVHMREVIVSEKRGSKRALEGRVVALRKRQGSPPLKEHVQTYVPLKLEMIKTENGFVVFGADETVPFFFNVSFMTNARPVCVMQAAVTTVARILSSQEEGVNLARQWLFPEIEDFTDKPSVMLRNGQIAEAQWVDAGLNAEQRLAVISVSLYQSPVPRLISGPPGTGKTRTVVEAVLQIFRVQPESCILLCAPSNPATDTLVLRLQKHLLQHEMLRLNDPNRTFAEVPDTITPYCYVEDNKFAIPPWKTLMKYRVVVTSCLDASILVGVQCTNTKLMAMEGDIAGSLHPHRRPKHVVQPHWTHLLIDEAAQGSEPELLIPISVVLPEVYGEEVKDRTFMPQFALCGDIHQRYRPSCCLERARTAELEVSLLERLFERPLYSNYMQDVRSQLAINNKRLPPYTTLVKVSTTQLPSHPVILMPPSAIFYNDTLEPFATSNGTIAWSGLANPALPLKFIGTASVEQSNDERASWFNPGQISIVVDVIKTLLDNPRSCDPPLRPGEISVMAPWRKQVWTLRKRLRNEGFSAVDVGTVEDYQGRESRVVIISCVRSSARFLEEDHKKGLGLIFERKRMNVAITRAKELLVVIGNGALLQRDPYWKSFLQFTVRNGLYEGPELSLEMDGNYISRLESELIHSGKQTSTIDPEAEGLVLAGGVARQVLRE
ncbi:P-loop containing nucleoside triphosphate hydrolase protein [Flammula alnicola]|nr:P-loop containing nucleoside triphosphate hydrolase protein [Flammula alnicola]